MAAKSGSLRPHEVRQSYARPRPQKSVPGEPELGDSFLIVTEGEVTEELYFESLRTTLQLGPVTVQVVHPRFTHAEGLVRAAMSRYDKDKQGRRMAKEASGNRGVEWFDHVWVLFDTDVPAQQGQLDRAMTLAREEDIHVGWSTPSIEVWLLLHFRDRPGPILESKNGERLLRDAWGQRYDKNASTFSQLWKAIKPTIPVAVERGQQIREYHKNANTPFPPDPSTQLDLLVRALNASVQPPMRILP